MVNQSKVRDQRFWRRWEKSGAVCPLKFNQQKHPEIQPGEVWITNTDSEGMRFIGRRTKRRGSVALDSRGRPIEQRAWAGCFPVFVQKSELDTSRKSNFDSFF